MIGLFAVTAFVVTAWKSWGKHSDHHDVMARVAMLVEGATLGAWLAGDGRLALIFAGLIAACFAAVAVTDQRDGETKLEIAMQMLRGGK